jgi:hypothetical protein
VSELLLALSVIAERGELPAQLATSLRERHLRALDGLCVLTYEARHKMLGNISVKRGSSLADIEVRPSPTLAINK